MILGWLVGRRIAGQRRKKDPEENNVITWTCPPLPEQLPYLQKVSDRVVTTEQLEASVLTIGNAPPFAECTVMEGTDSLVAMYGDLGLSFYLMYYNEESEIASEFGAGLFACYNFNNFADGDGHEYSFDGAPFTLTLGQAVTPEEPEKTIATGIAKLGFAKLGYIKLGGDS